MSALVGASTAASQTHVCPAAVAVGASTSRALAAPAGATPATTHLVHDPEAGVQVAEVVLSVEPSAARHRSCTRTVSPDVPGLTWTYPAYSAPGVTVGASALCTADAPAAGAVMRRPWYHEYALVEMDSVAFVVAVQPDVSTSAVSALKDSKLPADVVARPRNTRSANHVCPAAVAVARITTSAVAAVDGAVPTTPT
jgi:hypothetical protein